MISKLRQHLQLNLVRHSSRGMATTTTVQSSQRSISTKENTQYAGILDETGNVKSQAIHKLPQDSLLETRYKQAVRYITTLQDRTIPLVTQTVAAAEDIKYFKSLFPEINRELCEETKEYGGRDATAWLSKAMEYNVPHGKLNRGLLTVSTYKHLVKPENQTPENIKLANYLGWCVEMLQSYLLIADDVMDNGSIRRGQPCWYKVEGVGLIAINDALMIESAIYKLLKMHFRHLDCYTDLVDLFHEVTLITTFGQSLDILNSKKTVDEFTMENYKLIVTNKTAYYTFYLPVALALHLAGIKDPEIFRQAKTILLEMGDFYQVQDDFIDCFSTVEIKGKVGNDIEDNKCSWLAVVAMQRVNEENRKVMRECYGHSDPAKVQQVKDLYLQLGLPLTYANYEEESYNLIQTHIQQTSRGIPHEVFLEILDKIYKRSA